MNRRQVAATLAAFAVGFGAGTGTIAETQGPPPKPRVQVIQPPKATPGFPRETSVHPEGYAPASPPKSLPQARLNQRHISHNGLVLIEGFEGFSSCVYWDPYGSVWTRGYGETEGISGGSPCISRAYGESNLRYRVERYYEWALRPLNVKTQHEWDALASFAWNLGAGIFTGNLRSDLQSGQLHAAGNLMLQYDHAGGQVLEGLRTRRIAEVRLMLTPEHVESPREHQAKINFILHKEIGVRESIRHELTVHRCRVVHGKHAYKRCPSIARHGRLVVKEIAKLRHEGAR